MRAPRIDGHGRRLVPAPARKDTAAYMDEKVIVLPLAGELTGDTTPADFERFRRRAAYAYIQTALALWDDLYDLIGWLQVCALQEKRTGKEYDL